MGRLKIGILVECLRLDVKEGIKKAAELGADGIQVYVTGGEMAPENLSKTGRDDFLNFVASQGLEISALCGDLGRGGFRNPDGLEERVERTKRILDLSLDLRTPIVTTHIGLIPEERSSREWDMMLGAVEDLGSYAENIGSCLATETGPEDTELMKEFLDSVCNEGIKVNYDPANLVMNGFDPVKGVWDLKDYIVHTHAKDGVLTEEGPKEVRLGEGEVPFDEYIEALNGIGYEGFYTIEREVGEDPVGDIKKALDFLRKF